MKKTSFYRGHSLAADPKQAVRELHEMVYRPDVNFVLFFCSDEYDISALTDALNESFRGVTVVGCTSAGEIGPAGYVGKSLSGVGFSASDSHVVADLLKPLHSFQPCAAQPFTQTLLNRLESETHGSCTENTFAFLLIDGMSGREESVVFALHGALANIPLCGGSASDGMKFSKTWIFHDGAFHTDCALLLLVSTDLPFRMFMTQHFSGNTERMVVTSADASKRVIQELNGRPAATEYARVLGVDESELNPDLFAKYPVVILINGTYYVRSIQKINPDKSLTFFCAIEEGLVLRIASGRDLVLNLSQAFDHISDEIGMPQLTLGCDCILRNLEIVENGLNEQVGAILQGNHTVGFTTYGEQFGGVHVNQTFTGVSIGYKGGDDGG